MADVITRFKLETTQYDSKLRDSSKALAEITRQATLAGNEFGKYTQKSVEAARSLGNIATSATNSKDKVKELVGAFNDVAKAYNALTKEQQQSDFGKALAESMTTLKGRIAEAKQEMNSTGGVLGQLKEKFTINIDAMKLFNAGVTAAKVALDVAKDAFFQSESGIDEWGRTVEGAKGAYSVFLDTLNNGNWSAFFQNLTTAIQGGQDLYNTLDRLGSIKSNNAAAIAIVQQQIAQLRLAKQQGQNVDDQIKAATERLAALQGQSISAGKTAGNKTAFEVIRNGVNSIGNVGVNDATINYAIQRIMQNGQSEFDKYRYNYDTLQRKGTKYNVWTNKESFNISNLTQEEQRQYALAKAITEGETRIQKGIAVFAQAVQEGTASAREEFKGNRYAMQGSGGSSGGGGGGIDINALLRDSWSKASMVGGEKAMEMTGPSQAFQAYVASIKSGSEEASNSLQSLIDAFEALNKAEGVEARENTAKNVKAIGESARITASMVGTIGQAFNAIEDPAAKVMGTVAQAIATVALAYADTLAKDQSSKSNIWAFIAAAAASTVSMIATIASIHQATGYAHGGEIKGNTYSNDQIPIMANAGEVVLTRAMQGNLASQLNAQSSGGGYMPSHISGEQIYIALNRYVRRSGRGEIVTWKS